MKRTRSGSFFPARPDPESFKGRCRAAGMAESTVRTRMAAGMPLEEALKPGKLPRRALVGFGTGRTRSMGGDFVGGKEEKSPHQVFVDAFRAVLRKDPLYSEPATDEVWTSWRAILGLK